jgi:hypothetical protein
VEPPKPLGISLEFTRHQLAGARAVDVESELSDEVRQRMSTPRFERVAAKEPRLTAVGSR